MSGRHAASSDASLVLPRVRLYGCCLAFAQEIARRTIIRGSIAKRVGDDQGTR